MRRGPNYEQRIEYDENRGMFTMLVPLELCEDVADKPYVKWTDNGDGTYTLTPRSEM